MLLHLLKTLGEKILIVECDTGHGELNVKSVCIYIYINIVTMLIAFITVSMTLSHVFMSNNFLTSCRSMFSCV